LWLIDFQAHCKHCLYHLIHILGVWFSEVSVCLAELHTWSHILIPFSCSPQLVMFNRVFYSNFELLPHLLEAMRRLPILILFLSKQVGLSKACTMAVLLHFLLGTSNPPRCHTFTVIQVLAVTKPC
jgi:hypothetical protein